MMDAYLTDSMLQSDPLLDAAGIEPVVAREALGLPPPIPSPSDRGWLPRVLEGMYYESDRLERHESLLILEARSAAMVPSLKDPVAWAAAAAKRYSRDSIYSRISPTDIDLDLLRADLAVSRSFDFGHPRAVALLAAAQHRVAEHLTHRRLYDPYAPDPDDYETRPIFPEIQEHDDATSVDGQAADLAAGWARSIYLQAPTHDDGVRRLRDRFAGVIFNGTLYQRA